MAGARKAWNRRVRAEAGGTRARARDYVKSTRRYAQKKGMSYERARDFIHSHYDGPKGVGTSGLFKDLERSSAGEKAKRQARRSRKRSATSGAASRRGASAFRRGFTF